MLPISHRGASMPHSPIRKLAHLSDAAKAKGIKVYHLNIGQPDLPSPPQSLVALKNYNRPLFEYTPSDGFPDLREQLAAYYSKYSINVSKDDIIITAGGSEAVLFAFLACLDPGDEIIVPEPAYANYLAFAISVGAVVRPVTASMDDNFRMPPVESFEATITPRTKGILLCNPNNPTGYVYTAKDMEKVRKLAIEHNLFIFSDEVYREFIYGDSPYISAFHLKGVEENVVLIDSVSKRYSECGLRIGALVTKNRLLRNTVMKFCQARLCPPLLGQLVSLASLQASDNYFTETASEYRRRRDFLVKRLNRIPGVYSPLPMGAFYTIARLPVKNADHFCSWCLSDFSYQNQTVFLAPASGFYFSPLKGENEVRVAYVLNCNEIEKALTILEKALEEYKKVEK